MVVQNEMVGNAAPFDFAQDKLLSTLRFGDMRHLH